jgi:excisionase family DNA binding protein
MQNSESRMPASPSSTESDPRTDTAPPAGNSRWLTIREGATWARVGVRQLYEAVHRGDLRAVRVGGRGELRFRQEWLDQWLLSAPAVPRRRR